MKRSSSIALLLATALCGLAICDASALTITAQDDGYRVKGRTYQAVVDSQGHFRSLVVEDMELLEARKEKGKPRVGGHFPGDKPAARVVRDDDAIVASRDDIQVRYSFDDTGFTIQTKGGVVRWYLSDKVTACIGKDEVIPRKGTAGDIYRIVAGAAAVAVDQPHHVQWGRAFPSKLPRGGKAHEPFKARWTCGVEVAPVELVDLAVLKPTDHDPRVTARYDADQTPNMTVELKSYAATPAKLRVRWTAHDHPHNGEQVAAGEQPVELAPGKTTEVRFDVPVKDAGLFWVRAGLHHADAPAGEQLKPMQSATRAFIYDRENYKPPLTRPDDFRAFWDDQLKAMRKIPFKPEMTANDKYAIAGYKGYDLQITGHDGQRLKCVLIVPDAAGPHDAEVNSYRGSATNIRKQLQKFAGQPAGVGMWQRGARRIHVGAPIPEQSTYQRWDGRDDNNMLASYLRMVRLADYLRSRDDVKHIWLFGASRTGASMLAAAALAPEKVAAVNVHVPTCCGISWADRPYRGWGRPPSRGDQGLKTAAYFDPVNFAPDLAVPVVMDGGIYDGLAPAPGILAFRNHATNAPFRRCSIEQGPHGNFQKPRRGELEAELAAYLRKQGIDPAAEAEKDNDNADRN